MISPFIYSSSTGRPRWGGADLGLRLQVPNISNFSFLYPLKSSRIYVLTCNFISMMICCWLLPLFVVEFAEIFQVAETPFSFQFAHKVSVTDFVLSQSCLIGLKKSFYMKWWFVSTSLPIYIVLLKSTSDLCSFLVLDMFPIFSPILSFVILFWYIFRKLASTMTCSYGNKKWKKESPMPLLPIR